MAPHLSKIIIICSLIIPSLCCCTSHAQTVKVFRSNLTTIQYFNNKQIDRFFSLIKPNRKAHTLYKKYVNTSESEHARQIYMDTVFRSVQKLLGMVMPKLRVNIYLFRRQKDLYQYFSKIHGGPNKYQIKLGVNNRLPSFYFKKRNTIYAQAEVYSLGILAHEMGHCVTEHYFVVRPPQAVSELMSQFVDREITAGRFLP